MSMSVGGHCGISSCSRGPHNLTFSFSDQFSLIGKTISQRESPLVADKQFLQIKMLIFGPFNGHFLKDIGSETNIKVVLFGGRPCLHHTLLDCSI